MEPKKSYFAVIPASVRYCDGLNANAKLLYGEITALCNEQGYCWANNHYFAALYKVEKETVSRWISKLEKKGFITTQVDPEKGNSRKVFITDTYIQKSQEVLTKKSRPSRQKSQDPLDEKVNNNNTVNNTLNNTDISQRTILSEIQKEYPVVFDSVLKGQTFHERLQKMLHADKLPAALDKDILPVLIHWIINKWTANDLDKPVTRLTSEAASYLLQVVRSGGLSKKKAEKEEPKPAYMRKIS